ncbi:MAG: HAMP domain-containing sensor histidine kinase [Sphingobium sp.]
MKHPSFPYQEPPLCAEADGKKRHSTERLRAKQVSDVIHAAATDQALLHANQNSSADERLMVTAGVTHELRTPLTILKGRLHGIEDGVIKPDPDETARLLRQVEHVLAIVNDLDTLTQADLGRLSLQRREVNLVEIAAAVVSDLRPLLARHGMEIVEAYENVHLLADPIRITQIVTNLLTNASKHSPAGGRITMQVEASGKTAWLSVMDEGPGFAPSDSERLFTPFWRSAATIKRPGCPGTGIGLALTARLVAAHGGNITAENRQDRSGACFRVVLPIS